MSGAASANFLLPRPPPRDSAKDELMSTSAAMPPFNVGAEHIRFKDVAEMRRFAQRFIDLWDRDRDRQVTMLVEYANAGGPVIWSLANHSVELCRTLLLLSEQNRLIVAMPLMRLMIENAVSAVWLHLKPEAGRAMVAEGLRQRVAAIREIISQDAAGFTQETLDDWQSQLDEFKIDAHPEGKSFEQRCLAIDGGGSLYTTWRVASSLSHAGMAIGDFYLESAEITNSNPLGIEMHPDAVLSPHEAWLGTSICMLLTSLKAFDYVTEKRRFRAQIDAGAKRMGIELNFKLKQQSTAAGEPSQA
jgi:hypothetical protein